MTKPLLFSPIALRELTLKNRVVISPMATYAAIDGMANDWHVAHLGRLALGGAGAVFLEVCAVTAQGRVTNGDLGIWSDDHVPGLERLATFIRGQGVAAGIQIGHSGRKGAMQRPWHGNGPLTSADLARGDKVWDVVGPTGEALGQGYLVPRQLSVADLQVLKGQWVDAAKRAVEAGFDMLEIHNAHGYLMHQFLSPLTNKRNDGWGGDFAGRTRFPLDVAAAIRDVWPKEKPLFLRVSAVDGVDGGWSLDDTIAYAKLLKERGVDVIDCSSGGISGPATVARVKRTYGFQVPYAERVRREVGIKSMAVGLIVEPKHAEAILQNGEADLIAIGREALVNPCWPQMAEIALGRPPADAMGDWAVAYGWWLKHRERNLEQIQKDENKPPLRYL